MKIRQRCITSVFWDLNCTKNPVLRLTMMSNKNMKPVEDDEETDVNY